MEILKPFINFDEVEDGVLIVNKDCECYCVTYDNNTYLAWRNVDSVTNIDDDGNSIEYKNSYFNILNGKCILKETIIENNGRIEKETSAKIQLLKDILKITGNKTYTYYKKDVMDFTNFKEQKPINPGKKLF